MRISFTVVLLLLLSSCIKGEGEGGSATIKGVIVEQRINPFGSIISEYPIGNERVFIIYGDNSNFYDDDIRTSYDGSFEFRYLLKGNYRVFTYEECPTCPGGQAAVLREVVITKKKELVDLDTIYIRNF